MKLDPKTGSEIQIRLFKNVKNCKEIKEKVTNGELKCCALNPSLIYNDFQLIVAANKALLSEKLITKSIYTEIIFNLSISTSIVKSLQTFGVKNDDESLIILTVSNVESKSEDEIDEFVQGEEIDILELNNLRDVNAIKKVYKITEEEAKVTPMEDSIVSRIVTKDFLT